MIHYYLKKIQYFLFKKYNFPKQSLDYFSNKKKKTLVSFSSIEGNKLYIQKNEFFSLTKKFNVLFIKVSSRSTAYAAVIIARDITDMVIGDLKFIF